MLTMPFLRLLVLVAIVVSCQSAPLKQYEVVRIDVGELRQAIESEGSFTLPFLDRKLRMDLRRDETLPDQFRVIILNKDGSREELVMKDGGSFGVGRLGDAGWARFSIVEGELVASLSVDGQGWYLEPLSNLEAKARPDDFALYSADWVQEEVSLRDDADRLTQVPAKDPVPRLRGSLGLALAADRKYFERTSETPLSWYSHQRALVHHANAVFERDLGIAFVPRAHILELRSERLKSSDSKKLLADLPRTSFDAFQVNLSFPRYRDREGIEIVHLTTGNALERSGLLGRIAGRAFREGVHSVSTQHGRVRSRTGPHLLLRTQISTFVHELGHNLGATHEAKDRWCILGPDWFCLDAATTVMGNESEDGVLEFSSGKRDPARNNVQIMRDHLEVRHLQKYFEEP